MAEPFAVRTLALPVLIILVLLALAMALAWWPGRFPVPGPRPDLSPVGMEEQATMDSARRFARPPPDDQTGRVWWEPDPDQADAWIGGAAMPQIGKLTAPVDLGWTVSPADDEGQRALRVLLTPRRSGRLLRVRLESQDGQITLENAAAEQVEPQIGQSWSTRWPLGGGDQGAWLVLRYDLDGVGRSVRFPVGWDGVEPDAPVPPGWIIDDERGEILMPADAPPP